MFKRIKRMWDLSNRDLTKYESLTEEEIKALPLAGDGKATFFSEPTPDDEKELERENKGFKGIFGIGL